MKFTKVGFTMCGALLALGWMVSMRSGTTASDSEAGRTGPAPTVIDAAKYPNLQAAFDAVPITGGLVKLPPGDFRLQEPLVLERPETRVEGAGAATRLINCNQEGQPALIVRPPNWKSDPKAFVWRVQLADFRICGDPNVVDARSTEPKSGDGLLAQRVNELYVAISGNVFSGLNRQAIEADAQCRRVTITNNVMVDLNRRTDAARPALDLRGAQETIVEHNLIAEPPAK